MTRNLTSGLRFSISRLSQPPVRTFYTSDDGNLPYNSTENIAIMSSRLRLEQTQCCSDYDSIKQVDKFPSPPEPWSCCGSGCQNCVWIEYALAVSKHLVRHYDKIDNDKRSKAKIIEDTLNKNVDDESLRAYLLMELRTRKIID